MYKRIFVKANENIRRKKKRVPPSCLATTVHRYTSQSVHLTPTQPRAVFDCCSMDHPHSRPIFRPKNLQPSITPPIHTISIRYFSHNRVFWLRPVRHPYPPDPKRTFPSISFFFFYYLFPFVVDIGLMFSGDSQVEPS